MIAVVVVVFLGFWMFSDPAASPRPRSPPAARAGALTTEVFSGVIDFVGAL